MTYAPAPSATPSQSPSETAPAAASPSPMLARSGRDGFAVRYARHRWCGVAVLLAGGGIMWSVRKRRTAQLT